MRVLITGGTGFVGKHLLDAIMLNVTAEKLDDVIVASRSPDLVGYDVETLVWDVTSDEFPDLHVDAVIHAATPASASLNARSPRFIFDQITYGTRQVIRFCAAQPKTPLLVFVSSGAVYGEMPPEVAAWAESSRLAADPLIAKNAYASGKRSAEALIGLGWDEGACRPIIARLFTFSGRHLPLDRHYALGNFIADAALSRPITVRGTGAAIRSYLDGEDMARWLLASMHKPEAVGKVLHIGSEEPISIKDLAHLVALRAEEAAGETLPVIVENGTSDLDGLDRYVPQTRLTRDLLGIETEIPLQVSIDRMLAYARRPIDKKTPLTPSRCL